MNESRFYSQDFWYNQTDKHDSGTGYGENYYAHRLVKSLIPRLGDIPDGLIVVMGTLNCVTLNYLCDIFGKDRCMGIDIANPHDHPCVKVTNVLDLGAEDVMPIAFVQNDLGSFPTTPLAKLHAQTWAAKNVVDGGYFFGRNNSNSADYPLEQLMERLGFTNASLSSLTGLVDFEDIGMEHLDSHMLSRKVRSHVFDGFGKNHLQNCSKSG